jgi:CDP-diacylglycerol--inositol 3-phosphatidyltransferase
MVGTRSHTRRRGGPGFFERHDNVFLYVPNLIGYARVAAAIYAFGVALHDPAATVLAYFASFVCDELDGRFARKFGQSSTFGAVLDMVTDRVATTCLLAVLCIVYPAWHLPCLLLIMLDISSHWFQMYSTLAMGATTHKDTHSRSLIVRAYYSSRMFMGFCCICCEVLYLALYLLSWPLWQAPAVGLPAVLAGLQLAPGVVLPAALPVVALVALAAVPGFAVKQLVNVVQLRTAAQQLVLYDKQGRRAKQ